MWDSELFLKKLSRFRASSSSDDTHYFKTSIPNEYHEYPGIDYDFPTFLQNHRDIWQPEEVDESFISYTAFCKHESMSNNDFEVLINTCRSDRNCTMITNEAIYNDTEPGCIMYRNNDNILLLYRRFPDTITLFDDHSKNTENTYNFTKATITPNDVRLNILAEYTYVRSRNKRRRLAEAESLETAAGNASRKQKLAALAEKFKQIDEHKLETTVVVQK
tara:strand:+ start:57 stop:713 length:657 start_codon:yes stop_codon:yes gene_type:complete